jgi:SAM-dependent methyltransferase
MEDIYRQLPADQIPWNIEQPPKMLVDLVRSGRIQPCDAVDVGCGTGNYAVWLAKQGFRMTGIDISPAAVQLARRQALESGVQCEFLEGDFTGDIERRHCVFDFAYDWEVLHHVFPDKRNTYVNNIHAILRPGAKYLSVCFSDRDRDFGGEGQYRSTPLGTTLYFSSEREIEQLITPLFQILDLDTVEIAGKYGPHLVVAALCERK